MSSLWRNTSKPYALGLEHFGRRFGAYPYPTLTVVVPPRRARGAAGMEYPGLFLTDGSWLPAPGSPGVSGAFVTAHELAHQWFPGVLASNEVRYPVLDEGFAEWAALDLLRTRFGETGAFSEWLPFSRFELERIGTWSFDHAIAPGLAAPAYTPREYGASVYGEAALVLETIRRVFGEPRFDEALRTYTKANWFSHPTPADLAARLRRSLRDGLLGARTPAPVDRRQAGLPAHRPGEHAGQGQRLRHRSARASHR